MFGRALAVAGISAVLITSVSSAALAGDGFNGDTVTNRGGQTLPDQAGNGIDPSKMPKGMISKDVTDPASIHLAPTEKRGDVTLISDRSYSKAEVDAIVAAKKGINPKAPVTGNAGTPSIVLPQNYPYEGGSGGFYFQRANCQYWLFTPNPDMCLSVYYNGEQNMAYYDHMSGARGSYFWTFADICRANSAGACYSYTQNVGYQSDAGWFAYFAGPVYSGYSRATCITARGQAKFSNIIWNAYMTGFCG